MDQSSILCPAVATASTTEPTATRPNAMSAASLPTSPVIDSPHDHAPATRSSVHPAPFPDQAYASVHFAVDRLIRQQRIREADRDDVTQDILLTLVERWPRFDPARAKASTFLKTCIEHRLANLVRDRHRQCRNPRLRAAIVDDQAANEPVEQDESTRTNPEAVADPASTRAQQHRDLRLDIEAVLRGEPAWVQAIAARLADHRPHAIAKQVGCSHRRVASAIARLRDRLRAAGLAPVVIHSPALTHAAAPVAAAPVPAECTGKSARPMG